MGGLDSDCRESDLPAAHTFPVLQGTLAGDPAVQAPAALFEPLFPEGAGGLSDHPDSLETAAGIIELARCIAARVLRDPTTLPPGDRSPAGLSKI